MQNYIPSLTPIFKQKRDMKQNTKMDPSNPTGTCWNMPGTSNSMVHFLFSPSGESKY